MWPYFHPAPTEVVAARARAGALRTPWPLTSAGLGMTQEGFLGQDVALFQELQELLLCWHAEARPQGAPNQESGTSSSRRRLSM